MKTNQKIKTQKMTIVEKQTNNAQSKCEEKGSLKENLEPQSIDKNTQTSVQGKNIVGGVVGMLFGDSRLSDIKVKDIDIDSSYYNKASNK